MTQLPAFSFGHVPSIVFGAGTRAQLPTLAGRYGNTVLLVTGKQALQRTPAWAELLTGLQAAGLQWRHVTIDGEPSPSRMDALSSQHREAGIDVVLAIGGGSVLDAGKALAGLLRVPNSVMDFLEGVGPELPYPGPAVPLIAVPTTAGTGSEATKNAVLSQQGEGGFKKSFRHDTLVPAYAVVDPDLLASCPQALIAANGMDALTQLLESYVSTRANPITDALAMSGLRAVRDSLIGWYQGAGDPDAGDQAQHRANMAYAAMLSGITLAQVGLGSVHGLAAPLGAFFPMPHGVVCGTLVAACTRANIRLLQVQHDAQGAQAKTSSHSALWRYAHVGKVLVNDMRLTEQQGLDALCATLEAWTTAMQLPGLSAFGMSAADIPRVVANCRGSSMKTNPIMLGDDELAAILHERL